MREWKSTRSSTFAVLNAVFFLILQRQGNRLCVNLI